MALSATSMSEAIRAAFLDTVPESAAQANQIFGDTILQNIVDTCLITYGWSAQNPSSGSSDPVRSFVAGLSMGNGVLTPASDFGSWRTIFSNFLRTLVITPPTGFTLAPLTIHPSAIIQFNMNASENTFDAARNNFCTRLIADFCSLFPNPSPVSGSRGAFVGATTGMVII